MFWITQRYSDLKEFGAKYLKFCNWKECRIMFSGVGVVLFFKMISLVIAFAKCQRAELPIRAAVQFVLKCHELP